MRRLKFVRTGSILIQQCVTPIFNALMVISTQISSVLMISYSMVRSVIILKMSHAESLKMNHALLATVFGMAILRLQKSRLMLEYGIHGTQLGTLNFRICLIATQQLHGIL